MQNMQIMKRAVLCTFALAVSAVFAAPALTDYYWATNSAGESVSASFGDVANWWADVNGIGASGLPDACSRARFWFAGPSVNDGGYTVTLPTMQMKATLCIHARRNIPITFDGSGNVFQALSTDTDNYGEHIISIYGGQNSPDAGFEQAYFENASFRGGYKLTDAVFTVTPKWISNGSLDSVVFKQGEFNFYDPEGIPLDTTFVIRGQNDDVDSKYVFEPASQLRINGISFAQNGATRRQTLRFNGNTHHVFGDLHIARDNGNGRISSVHVDAGATLYAGRFRMSNSKPSSASGYNGTHQLFVENGGMLVCSNGVNIAAYGTQLVAITNGANVAFGMAATLPLNRIYGADDGGWHGYSTNVVLVKDSTLTMIGTNDFNGTHIVLDNATANFGNSFSFGKESDSYTTLSATNSIINFGNVAANFGCKYGQRVTVDMYNANINGTGSIRFGQYAYNNTYRMNASCDVTVDGPESAISLNSSRNGSYLFIGDNGSGVLRMKDGSINVYALQMGAGSHCVTSVLHQTGGRITVTGGKFAPDENQTYEFRVQASSTSPVNCRVILDGGEICVHRFRARNRGARLDANGGSLVGIQAVSAENNTMVEGFDEANLGERGLTIRSEYETRTAQDFRDMEGHEGRGLLRLDGAGTKKLYGTNSTESVLMCAGGKTQFVPNAATGANASHYANVIVTNGAALSIADGQTAATFRSLTLARGAHLEMEKSDRITVDGLVAVGENLILDIIDGAAVGSYPLVVCEGEASSESILNWRRAVVTISGRTNLGVTPIAAYDSATDKTTFSVEITEGGPLSDVTWNGTWNNVTGADRVTFAGGGTASAAVDADVKVGALAFDSSVDYTLSGSGTLSFSDRGGYARVDVARGEQTISTMINAPSDLTLAVASGAKLAVDGEIIVGGVIKEGRGTVSVENAANDLSAGVTVKEGVLSAATPDALGKGPIALKGGTLEITGEGIVDAPSVTLETEYAATAAVVKVEADVSMPAPSATQGAFIKRGAGRLTLTSDRPVTLCGTDAGTLANMNNEKVRSETVFDSEGGYSISGQYAFGGFNVAEGELVLRGIAPDVTFTVPAYACVGIGTSQGAATPGLVIDHATIQCIGGHRFTLGNTLNSVFATAPYLIVTNKATLSGNFTCGWYATTAKLNAKCLVDDSVQFSNYMFYPMRGNKSAEYVYRNGSALYVNNGGTDAPEKTYYGVVFDNGPATLTFSNSVLARKTALASDVTLPVTIANESNSTNHEVRLRNGSTLYSNWVTNKYSASVAMLTVGFDDSEWKPIRSDETGDFTFDFPPYETVRFEMEGRGVILSPARGRTFTVVSPFVGEGGMRKRGAGTLAFACKDGMKSWDFGGTLSLEEGVVTLAAGAVREGAKAEIAGDAALDLNGTTLERAVISGEGTVANGTLHSSMIMVDVTDGGVVTDSVKFSNVAFSGRTVIDFGRTEETPLPDRSLAVILFSYAGNAPDVSGWQLKGTGRGNVEGRFEAAGGVVKCTIARTGLFIIVR